MNENVWIAFLLSAAAGLSTGIGGLLAVFTKKTNTRFLTFALGLSAGVMVYISLIEMMPQAGELLSSGLGARRGEFYRLLFFFLGMALIAVIDKLIPESENPHEAANWEGGSNQTNLRRAGVLTALAVSIHNFPEGMASFVSTLRNVEMGLPIVLAIAVHNIPEGIAVAAPLYYSTGKKGKALLMSLLSGVAEPIGALLGYLVLMPYMSDTLYGILYAAVSGIMVFISFDELLPSAERYGEHHVAVAGVIIGMLIMAISLVMFS